MDYEGAHIRFVEGEPKPKTKTWVVVTTDGAVQLGGVGWFGQWRTYAFFPVANRVFEKTCLRDIAAFCEARTKEHRERAA